MAATTRRAGILVLVGLAVGGGRSRAQEHSEVVPPLSLKQHAVSLARAGWGSRDPRAILAAAELLLLLNQGTGGIRRVLGDESLPPDWDVPASFDAPSLLRLASELAVDRGDRATAEATAALARPELGVSDTALSATLGRAAAALAGARGAVGAPRTVEGFLNEGETAEYAIPFEGGGSENHVTVSLSRDRGSFSCALYDAPAAAANRSAARTVDSQAGRCGLTWRQESPGEVILRIRNTGPATYFVLLTN